MAIANLVWKLLIAVALCIIVGATAMSYIETLYMKAQLKQEVKELRKLKKEIDEVRHSDSASGGV